MPLSTLTAVLLTVAALFTVTLVVLIVRRRRRLPSARLNKCCSDLLHQVLIPTGKEGEEAEIQLEYALLCPRGIVIINLKDIAGNVFGSDAMKEWAVITGKSRFGFSNPQYGLFDRIAAVKALLPGVPVTGFIAFGSQASFTKGIPSHVIKFDELVAELTQELAQSDAPAYTDAWDKLKLAATPAL